MIQREFTDKTLALSRIRVKLRILFLFLSVSVFAESSIKSQMAIHGLPAKVTILVVDQNENPVPNANVQFSFRISSKRESTIIKSETDEKGLATGESCVNQTISILVQKKGYYESFLTYNVWKGIHGYENGRWEPWNPTIRVLLKEKKHPRKRKFTHRTKEFSAVTPTLGFDLVSGCFISDNQSGIMDVMIETNGSFFSKEIKVDDLWSARVSFFFTNPDNGMICKERSFLSDFRYDYEAPNDGYESSISFKINKTHNGYIKEKDFPSESSSYYIFSISRTTEDGMTHKYYGIIEAIQIAKNWKTGTNYIDIRYIINPKSDDRNIEYYQ